MTSSGPVEKHWLKLMNGHMLGLYQMHSNTYLTNGTQMANLHMKRCSKSLASRDASRTTMRGLHTAIRMAVVQTEKDKYCMVSHTCEIKKKKRKDKTTKTD